MYVHANSDNACTICVKSLTVFVDSLDIKPQTLQLQNFSRMQYFYMCIDDKCMINVCISDL